MSVTHLELYRRHPDTGKDIAWKSFNDLPGFVYKVLNVDEACREIDMVFRFEPHAYCFNHRHRTRVISIVLAGEHIVREFDGAGNESVSLRRAGQYTVSAPDGAPHTEGGGDNGAVVFFNFRGDTDHIYDILDDDLNVLRKVSIRDFKRTLARW